MLSGAGPVDAVTGQARAMRRLFDSWGWGGADVAGLIDPAMGRAVRPLRTLRPDPDDVLLFHYSAYAPHLVGLLDLPNPKLLISHNVTPARFFWDHDPSSAIQCSLGRRQLPRFAQAVDVAAGVSHYNVAELQAAGALRTEVLPILFDERALPPAAAPRRTSTAPTILFVGRVAPHKRQEEVLRAFAAYRTQHAPDARLALVGSPLTPAYGAAIAELADQLAPGAVTLESGLTDRALGERYAQADAFLCLSEHEGFCVPLLEAFHHGVPVLARPSGGIPEVAGDAALLVDDRDPAVVAELLALVVTDLQLRTELQARGRARLAEYAFQHTAEKLRRVVAEVATMKNGRERV